MAMVLEISRSVLDEIAREAAASPRSEICGLLFGKADRIDAHQPCRNVAAQPGDSFEIDPAALIAAYRAARGGGPSIAGCYHSHPGGAATPSPRDADAASPNGWIWLISGKEGARAYRAIEGGAIVGRFDSLDYQSGP